MCAALMWKPRWSMPHATAPPAVPCSTRRRSRTRGSSGAPRGPQRADGDGCVPRLCGSPDGVCLTRPLRQRYLAVRAEDLDRVEVLARRVGRNELTAMDVCRAYVEAQMEYASRDRSASGTLQYAQKILSSPGKKDGLYWEGELKIF